MSFPDSVIKHDGRKVAFDARRLESSVQRAARAADPALSAAAAARLGHEASAVVGSAALAEGRNVIATADIRALTMRALRANHCDAAADAYLEHARVASLLLWRVRVIEPDMPRLGSSGSPWDRRRLLESLHASGVALDTAGAVARDVERRIVAFGSEYVSPALIHALALLALPAGAYGIRAYAVRRVAYSAAANLPHYDAKIAAEHPLPPGSVALEQFWLQGVHSGEVINAVRDNLISLVPYPASPDAQPSVTRVVWADPLELESEKFLKECTTGAARQVIVRADDAGRRERVGAFLARISNAAELKPLPGAEWMLCFAPQPQEVFDGSVRAAPMTVNVGGMVARENLRDPRKIATRLAAVAVLAAQAHREREEYFKLSPVRGRILPIAAAGLWNAAAWIQGEDFDALRDDRGSYNLIEQFCRTLRAAVQSQRELSGMELLLTASAPLAAERELWRDEREFFLRDGRALSAAAAYEANPQPRLSAGIDDFTSRLDFAKALGNCFDEPPALTIEVPLAPETSAEHWSELLQALSKAGVVRLRLVVGGSPRAVPNLLKAVNSYLIGFPLLDGLGQEEELLNFGKE